MKCERCGKRDATTRVYQNDNGKETMLFLCDECAGNTINPSMDLFQKLLGGSYGMFSNLTGLIDTPKSLRCPKCGTSSEQFLRTGFVGCPHCYEAFEPLILQAVKQFQQSDTHIGKSPLLQEQSEEERLAAEAHKAFINKDYDLMTQLSYKLQQLKHRNSED